MRLDATGHVGPAFGVRIFRAADGPALMSELRDGLLLLPDDRLALGPAAADDAVDHRVQHTLVRTLRDGTLGRTFGIDGGVRHATVDAFGIGQSGDRNRLHAIASGRADDSVLVYGRTSLEDGSNGEDYVTLVRARLDLVFDDDFGR